MLREAGEKEFQFSGQSLGRTLRVMDSMEKAFQEICTIRHQRTMNERQDVMVLTQC
jgi:hypothetical protein